MSDDKAIRAAKLTLGAMMEERRAKAAKTRAGGQIAPSKYLPGVPRQAHNTGGRVSGIRIPDPVALPTGQTGYVPMGTLEVPTLRTPTPIAPSSSPTFMQSVASLGETADKVSGMVTGRKPEEEEEAAAPAEAPPAEVVAHNYGEGVSPEAAAAMDRLRASWTGPSFEIVSDYRDPHHNAREGGADDSEHTRGNAFDVGTGSWDHDQRIQLARAAWDAGFRGYGFYNNNLHFDIGAPRAWGHNHSYDTLPSWSHNFVSEYLPDTYARVREARAPGGKVGDGPNLLDFSREDFNAALSEWRLDPQREADLRDQYRRHNSAAGAPVQAISDADATLAADGRVRASMLPMSRPEGVGGWEAYQTGQADWAWPGALTGGASAAISAVDAPAAAYRGDLTPDQMTQEAINLAGMVAAGGARSVTRSAPEPIPNGLSEAQQVAYLLRSGRANEVTAQMRAWADPEEMWRLYTNGETGMDMDMDHASRMARAQDMGFNIDTLLYRGDDQPHLQQFQTGFGNRRRNIGVTASNSPDVAGTYLQGDNPAIYPLLARSENPLLLDVDGGNWNQIAPNADTMNGALNSVLKPRDYLTDPHLRNFRRRDYGQTGSPSFTSTDDVSRAAQRRGFDQVRFVNIVDRGADDRFETPQSDRPNMTVMTADPSGVRSPFAVFDPRLAHLSNLSAGVAGAAYLSQPDDPKADQQRGGFAAGGAVDDEPDPGNVADLGQARYQKQLQGYHQGLMGDMRQRMSDAMEAHRKAVEQGVFDGFEVGDVLQGSAHPMRITGKFMSPWKPTKMTLQAFERMKTSPTIVEHNDRQYIPMLRYETGVEGQDGYQEGHAYLDGVRAAKYPKMGGLRAVKADGGAVDGPEGASLQNPYVWDASSPELHEDMARMGIKNGQMDRQDMDRFMQHMAERGHDGVLIKGPSERGSQVSEIVVFKPNA